MRIIAIDFETYFDDDYTLKKLTTEEYIRHERFEPLGAAVRDAGVPGQQSTWMEPNELKEYLESIKAPANEPVACLAHHAHFDGLILSHHFGFRPDVWLDTLSMARVVFDSGVRNGLDDIAARLGLRPKSVPYDLFRGKHWNELDSQTKYQVAEGACWDNDLAWQAFNIMMQGGHPAVPYRFPPSELPVIDLTIKMFTNPTLVGDLEKLGAAWEAERKEMHDVLARYGFSGLSDDGLRQVLRNDTVFADLLYECEIEAETKQTNNGNTKFAFAKSDRFMQDLLTHEHPDVPLLAEARLRAFSSIYRTRVERYGWMATRGPMCVYLAYAAAHTRRWGGGDKTNFQNLPRPDPYRPQKGALRRAIKAP